MEFVRLRPSYRPLIHFRRHLGNRTFKSELPPLSRSLSGTSRTAPGTYDQEFVSEEPEIEELNDMERWILGKPEATVDQLAAHPHSSAVLLP